MESVSQRSLFQRMTLIAALMFEIFDSSCTVNAQTLFRGEIKRYKIINTRATTRISQMRWKKVPVWIHRSMFFLGTELTHAEARDSSIMHQG